MIIIMIRFDTLNEHYSTLRAYYACNRINISLNLAESSLLNFSRDSQCSKITYLISTETQLWTFKMSCQQKEIDPLGSTTGKQILLM